MTYGELPQSVAAALVQALANFDMTYEDREQARASLRDVPVAKFPSTVTMRVEQACEEVRTAWQ